MAGMPDQTSTTDTNIAAVILVRNAPGGLPFNVVLTALTGLTNPELTTTFIPGPQTEHPGGFYKLPDLVTGHALTTGATHSYNGLGETLTEALAMLAAQGVPGLDGQDVT